MKIVGLIGCGAIGTLICESVNRGIVSCDKMVLFDLDVEKAEKLKRSMRVACTIVGNIEEMLKLKPTVIVEAASIQAAKEYAEKIVNANVDLVIMSVGALLDLNLKSPKVHLPSGAIGGLDALSCANLAGVNEVVLTTRKNLKALGMSNLEEKVAYQGNAREAVRRFPKEMNVAATLALAVGHEKVKVRVVSDPNVNRNVHEVRVNWKHGNMLLKFENDPHPDNSKTSALAAWSATKLLKDILSAI